MRPTATGTPASGRVVLRPGPDRPRRRCRVLFETRAVRGCSSKSLEHFGVVSLALVALVVQKVVWRLRLDLTVVAKDIRENVGVLGWHGLLLEQRVDLGVVCRHVSEGFPAGRALVRGLDVVVVATRMDTMTTWL